ncbi:Alpha crystallin/Hsp20 domain and HSP20-like chaperone domain-containing protein [Strongyloides ratti]|uniref:Alpha crystallin/Hsp20 domain and HSP20-like chaperone domain-containing protein n=1 Tax=Strongyloides ratti TaxID=34506 RepID=A0A090LG96_STRRB|nr:Alpha crystallin/Hsp20 domain and HSP20-like chaperone domain-containing protein [Strongyloides ratti]CEF67153.1 Alpha crystallin/Hsp20 domain and HSP20-like chaperone domain-containing protein [Strongyloides ratti]
MKRSYFNLNQPIIDYPYETNNEDGFVKSTYFHNSFILTFHLKNVNAKEIKFNVIGDNVRIEIIKEGKSKSAKFVKSSYKIYKLPEDVDSRSIKYMFNDNGDLVITGERQK